MKTKNGWEGCESAILEVHRQGPGTTAPNNAIAQLAIDMALGELGDNDATERLHQRAGGDTLDLRIKLKGNAAGCLGTGCMGHTTSCPANNPDCRNSPARTVQQITRNVEGYRQ